MAEAIGLAASLLALSEAAFKASKSLYEAISSFRSHRQTIQDLQADLETLSAVLNQIRAYIETTHNDERFETLRKPIYYCMKECQEMYETLKQCSTHTTDARTSVRDWLKMQYRGKSFEETKQRLHGYKSTISVAFGLTTMQSQSIAQDSLEHLRAAIDGTKEDLEDQLAQVQQHIVSAEASLQTTLQEDRAAIQSCLDSLAQSSTTANNIHPNITVQNNRAGVGSRAINGTDTVQPRFNLTVIDNVAEQDAVMSNGVFSPVTLQALLGDSKKRDLLLEFQALQFATHGADTNALQSIANRMTAEGGGRALRSNPPIRAIDSNRIDETPFAANDENGEVLYEKRRNT